jgi:two-component system sensor histidine kinase QseC
MQRRLLAWVLAGVAAVWLATALMTWIDARHELDELLDSHLAQAAALLVVQQAQDLDERRVDAPILHRYAPKVAFQLFHKDRLVLRSANAPAAPMNAAGKRFKTGFRTVRLDGTEWRVFAAYGAERDIEVYVGEQTASRDSILWAVLRSTLWPMLVAVPLLALALWWAVRRGLAPMRQLGRTLAVRPPDALEPLDLAQAPAEMLPMMAALNGLFARIGVLLESERRFTADAAHELRTPIAAIRAQAQVALAERDEGLRRHALQATLEGCDRATRLVEQLLTLSRLEAAATSHAAPGGSPVAGARLDLVALVRRVVAEVAPKALAKGQRIAFEGAEPCQVSGDEMLLAVLVRNLVDNAVRYSPPAARIEVGVRREAGRTLLTVEDSGVGLTEQQSARLGERFFRVGDSDESGSGLGWSIVRRIAAVQGLALEVEPSVRLGGLAVRVGFPSAG